jgi:putative endonuclease
VLYIGITNDLERRLSEHFENKGNPKTFAGKYGCHYLIYFERFPNARFAIEREKELKKWSRVKKENLIRTMNPNWRFLNEEFKEQ